VVGSSTSVLALPCHNYSTWLDSCWLVSFWKFITKVGLVITLRQQWLPVIARQADIALMDHFITQGYKASQFIQLNRCRLYLQVITLTDIVSADGTCIIPDILAGIPLSDRRSSLKWPNQQRPPAKDWAVWLSALRSLQPRNKLVTPLGNWLVSNFHQSWFWFRDPLLPFLYRRDTTTNQWESFRGYSSDRRQTRSTPQLVFDLSRGQVTASTPDTLCPASLVPDRYTNLSTPTIGPPMLPTPCKDIAPLSLLQKLYAHPFYSDLFGPQPSSIEDLQPFVSGLQSGGISAVTRVHYDPPVLTHSWTSFILGGARYSKATSRGIVEGISSQKRLELESLLTVLFLVMTISQEYKVVGGSFTLYCLSKGLARQLGGLKYASVTAALADNSDLLSEYKYQLLLL
jgi:hypothetical protein